VKIVWNSYHGRFSDNPRALWERLADRPELEHIWLADPAHRDRFPVGVDTVDITSRAARSALESADLLVANTHTELEWTKPASTTYLQTWHGTPLKRIHRDVLWAPEGRLDRLDRDVARWDLLLSPNPVSTPRLRGAFRYTGEVLESGYPRNDVLADARATAVRDRMRAELGVDDDTTVVLYAPTWRDDETFAEGAPPLRYPLDVAAFMAALGDDHVLLVRAHNMMTGRASLEALPGVHDMSFHPDVSELYCAADVLLTDYSSAMFDFAITGRPIVHLAHDLDAFESTIRGFYADFRSEAAGPVVSSTAEVVDLLRDLPAVEAAYAERYRVFRDRYAVLEDGHAADRVLARLGLA
jgi:CDP-glycerol glycerophosphotransferase